jgi:cellulose synthase/poly-beta-1,6-N-acetylglucosamine synthase-like glycosyltransferase
VLIPPSDHRAEILEGGISEARGDTILLLDEGVLPERPGWAQALIEGLKADPRIGLCGGRLLNADGSIRSTGLALVDSEDGGIALEAEFSGFPREFPAAAAAQRKVAVSLAMCALRRDARNEVGGLSSGYLTEAWNDADFCARLRRANWDVAYAHQATAMSIAEPRRPTGLGTDNAARIDAWSFVQYWSRKVSADVTSSSIAQVSALNKARAARPRAKSRSAA